MKNHETLRNNPSERAGELGRIAIAYRPEETPEHREQRLQEWARLDAKYPEIFVSPNQEEITNLIYDKIQNISKGDLSEIFAMSSIFNPTEEDYKARDSKIADVLAKALGLSKQIIAYQDKPSNKTCNGEYYDDDRNGIIVVYDRFRSLAPDKKTGKREYNNLEMANTIAHEIWHAFQHREMKNPDSKRGQLYRINRDNYRESKYGDEEYTMQLLELEAKTFGNVFEKLLVINRIGDDKEFQKQAIKKSSEILKRVSNEVGSDENKQHQRIAEILTPDQLEIMKIVGEIIDK